MPKVVTPSKFINLSKLASPVGVLELGKSEDNLFKSPRSQPDHLVWSQKGPSNEQCPLYVYMYNRNWEALPGFVLFQRVPIFELECSRWVG